MYSLARWLKPSRPAEPRAVVEQQAALVRYLFALEKASGDALPPFQLAALPSTIPGAGRGLFLTAGSIPAGNVATLYPGLYYDQETFMQLCIVPPEDAQAITPPPFTLSNTSLLALLCGRQHLLVDGHPRGLSAGRFLGAAAEAAERGLAVNTSWVQDGNDGHGLLATDAGSGPLMMQQAALGHLANHPPAHIPVALQFDACPVPQGLPAHLLWWIPSLPCHAGGGWFGTHPRSEQQRWVPLLVAQRELCAGAQSGPVELFVNYNADPLSLGFHP